MLDNSIQRLMSNLGRRNIDAYYFENIEQAKDKVVEMIPLDSTVGIGNSQTLINMNISKILSERGNIVFDKTMAATKEEIKEQKKKALLSDWYITGTNAISAEGQLVNIDHSGNRVAAMLYGPEKVIVVIGTNKIVNTLDEAVKRVRNISAPANAKRAGLNPPCVELRKCVDCQSPERACYNFVIIEGQAVKGRMTVFIVNENLGF
ncbi:MAG TPA: lactate utilization protein [Clostridia bacterium]|nr:lactate utilization protein [Clostridia bacterium]